MSRALPRRALLVALALLLPVVGGCRRARAPSARGYDVLLVTLDTLRADHLGCYGDARAETPHLDGLARGGVRFEQAQSAVPLTLPSHATILSGLLPPHHGLRDNGRGALPADVDTLATRLARAGYRTGAFVGAFVLDHRYGLARGFARYDDEIVHDGAAGQGARLEAERPGSVVVDRALDWLAHGDGRPTFTWVHLYDAHAPYAPVEPWKSRFAGDPYSGEVAGVDAQVGRLLDALRRRGALAHTVIAVAGDHGESLGEHGELTHGLLLYQATLRVPLLLAAPGVLAPRVVREPVGLVDLAPTIAGLVEQPLPPRDGRDLSASLRAGGEPARADLYAETRYPATFGWSALRALRRGPRKYVEAPRAELYDLAADPRELHDLRAVDRRGAAALAQSLVAIGKGERQPAGGARADAESRARLASLGYAAPSGATTAGTRDPKDVVQLFRAFEQAHWAEDDGDLAGAARLLAPLVAGDPGNPVFRSTYARVLRDQGRLDEALVLYRQAAALAPGDPEVWYELATALQRAGKTDEARAALEEALRHDPDRPEAHNTLAILLAGEGKLDEARQHLETAAATAPRDAQVWNNLGNVLRGMGRADEAAQAYEKAVALDPRYPDPLNGLGALEVARQRPAQAIPWFDRALALAPAQHEARLNRGIALELAGDRAAAAAAYRDFLARTDGNGEYAPQREIARHLLARLGGS